MLIVSPQADLPSVSGMVSKACSGFGDAEDAWAMLLCQRSVLTCLRPTKEVLQALLGTLCFSGTAGQAQAAFEELSAFYADAEKAIPQGTSHEELQHARVRMLHVRMSLVCLSPAVWHPSLNDLWTNLQALGYRRQATPYVGGKAVMSGSGERETAFETQLQVPCDHVPRSRIMNVQLLFRILAVLCRRHAASGLDLSFKTQQVRTKIFTLSVVVVPRLTPPANGLQAPAKHLVIALHRLRLDPSVKSAMRHELSAGAEALLAAWAAADERSWRAVERDIAEELAALGQTHRASLRALMCLPGRGRPAWRLAQAAAVALVDGLLKGTAFTAAAAAGSRTPRGGGGPVEDLRRALGGPEEASRLIAAIKKQPNQQPIDYWKLMTVAQAADAVMWPSQVAGKKQW